MIRYIFRDDGPITLKNIDKVDPQEIGEALFNIANESQGRLTPKAILEAAKELESPLHYLFEWDNVKAANSYRLDQARQVIRVIRTVEDNKEPVRSFLSISDKSGVSYRSTKEVSNSSDLQLAVLRQAERDLEAWEKRYANLKEICDLVTVARDKAIERRKEMENRVQ